MIPQETGQIPPPPKVEEGICPLLHHYWDYLFYGHRSATALANFSWLILGRAFISSSYRASIRSSLASCACFCAAVSSFAILTFRIMCSNRYKISITHLYALSTKNTKNILLDQNSLSWYTCYEWKRVLSWKVKNERNHGAEPARKSRHRAY